VLLGGLGKALNFCVQLSTTPWSRIQIHTLITLK
jgi:hypothetical protein